MNTGKTLWSSHIGNVPKNHKFQNTRIIEPLDGKNLANELNLHNIYVTGSINEPLVITHRSSFMWFANCIQTKRRVARVLSEIR